MPKDVYAHHEQRHWRRHCCYRRFCFWRATGDDDCSASILWSSHLYANLRCCSGHHLLVCSSRGHTGLWGTSCYAGFWSTCVHAWFWRHFHCGAGFWNGCCHARFWHTSSNVGFWSSSCYARFWSCSCHSRFRSTRRHARFWSTRRYIRLWSTSSHNGVWSASFHASIGLRSTCTSRGHCGSHFLLCHPGHKCADHRAAGLWIRHHRHNGGSCDASIPQLRNWIVFLPQATGHHGGQFEL